MMPKGALPPDPRPLGKAHSKLGLFYYIFLFHKIDFKDFSLIILLN